MKARRWLGLLTLGVLVWSCGGESFSSDPLGGTGGVPSGGAQGRLGGAGAGGTANSGGSNSGGTGVGGTVSGGSSQGGTGGGSSAGGGDPTGGTAPNTTRECRAASDCELFSDCCSCGSVPKGSLYASCDLACIQSACAAMGVEDNGLLACSSGRCTFARTCDQNQVLCKAAAPQCPPGTTPEVVNTCYSGKCLPVTECYTVTSCDVCTGAGMLCVTQKVIAGVENGAGASHAQCLERKAPCAEAPTCECLDACDSGASCSQSAPDKFECVLFAPGSASD